MAGFQWRVGLMTSPQQAQASPIIRYYLPRYIHMTYHANGHCQDASGSSFQDCATAPKLEPLLIAANFTASTSLITATSYNNEQPIEYTAQVSSRLFKFLFSPKNNLPGHPDMARVLHELVFLMGIASRQSYYHFTSFLDIYLGDSKIAIWPMTSLDTCRALGGKRRSTVHARRLLQKPCVASDTRD